MENTNIRHELKEAIDAIAELARKPLEESQEVLTTEIYGLPYYFNRKTGKPERVSLPDIPVPDRAFPNSLDGLILLVQQEGVDLMLPQLSPELCLNADPDYYKPKLFVEVCGPGCVEVYTDNLNHVSKHIRLYTCEYRDIRFTAGRPMGHEEMMIALRARFQPTQDRDYLLQLLSSVTNEAKVTSADNGLNQQVTVNKGIANVQRERVKSIVSLRPYRTFPEVEQPESEFLVRLSSSEDGSITVTLHEADGGMWKLAARRIIGAYLMEKLENEITTGRVVVLA